MIQKVTYFLDKIVTEYYLPLYFFYSKQETMILFENLNIFSKKTISTVKVSVRKKFSDLNQVSEQKMKSLQCSL